MTSSQRALVEQARRQWSDHLRDRVIVVTGGARGIGRSMAEGLLASGARVASADKSWDGAEEFRKELDSSERGLALEMDITEGAAIDAAYEQVLHKFGTVDGLVNNAGLVSETLFAPNGHVKTLDTEDRDWEVMFGVNLFGTLKVIRRFVRPMLSQRSGTILNMVSSGVMTSSTGGAYFGARPWTTEMPYQATKSALTTMTFYLAQELRGDGVALNATMPGHTRASWFDETARAFHETGGVYAMRPLVSEHILPITFFLCSQGGPSRASVSGRLFHVPDWNYEHGFGDISTWADHGLPADIEARYKLLEDAMPDYWRAGLARAPFDVERVVYGMTMEKIRSQVQGLKE